MSKIIRWTGDETLAVARKAAEIQAETQQPDLECWRQAQNVLPAARHRKIITVAVLSPQCRELYKQHLRALARQQSTYTAAATTHEATAADSAAASTEPLTLPTESPLELLAQLVAKRFVDAFIDSAIEQLRRRSPDLYTAIEQLQQEPRAHTKPKQDSILIVGLLPNQQEQIRQKFGAKYDLKFVSSQESPQMISTRLGQARKILLMTQFINHSHQNAAYSLRSRDSVILVQGGPSNLSRELERLS